MVHSSSSFNPHCFRHRSFPQLAGAKVLQTQLGKGFFVFVVCLVVFLLLFFLLLDMHIVATVLQSCSILRFFSLF